MTRRYNGEGTVAKRRDGRWVAAVSLQGGRRKFVYARTREEAGKKLTELLKAKGDGLPIPTDRRVLRDFMQSWLEAVRPSLRPRTWQRYSEFVRLHIVPELGRLPISRITVEHVHRLHTKKLDQGLSASTVRHIHAVLRKALGDAARWGLVTRNVVALAKPPRPERREMTTLAPEQARAFVESARAERLEALFVLGLTTGMRRGELLGLRWKDVDLKRGVLHVSATLQRTAKGFVFLTLEDETGLSQAIVSPPLFAEYRSVILRSSGLIVEGIVQNTPVANLWAITAGPLTPNPSGLLSSDAMKVFMAEVQARFDYVVFDSPPMQPGNQ